MKQLAHLRNISLGCPADGGIRRIVERLGHAGHANQRSGHLTAFALGQLHHRQALHVTTYNVEHQGCAGILSEESRQIMAKVVKRGGAVKNVPERGRLLDNKQGVVHTLNIAIPFLYPHPMLHGVKKEVGEESTPQSTDFSRLLLQLLY